MADGDAARAAVEGKLEEVSSAFRGVFLLTLGVTAVLLVVGSLLSWWVARSVSRALTDSVEHFSLSAEQTTAAAEQIAIASQSVAAGATRQATAIQKTTQNVAEFVELASTNATNAADAKGYAESARLTAENGVSTMNRMTKAIENVKRSAGQTADIVDTIDGIAFQTNLLALNAAVEAARVGELGKGFSVVAEEVGNLAKRSAEASRQTKEIIDESISNAERGVSLCDEVLKALNSIDAGSRNVDQAIAKIADASREQANGIEHIRESVREVEGVAQSNAANSEQTAAAAEELSSQARQMDGLVGTLRSFVSRAPRESELETLEA